MIWGISMAPASVSWFTLGSGDKAAVIGPYKLLVGEYRDRDGFWWRIMYGYEKYASGDAMSLENAQALAENSIR